jgi:serine/threonine protein phosphatase PrpC
MPQSPVSAVCPACAEPLEPDDRFCGVCGADLNPSPDAGTDAVANGVAGDGPTVPGTGTAPGEPDGYELAPPAGPVPAAGTGAAAPVPPPAPPGDDRAVRFGPPATDPREEPPASVPRPGAGSRSGPGSGPEQPTCVACGVGEVDADGYCGYCGHAQPRPRDHQELELEGVAAVSDRGLRHHRNEDAFAVSATSLPDGTPAVVAVVCDGVSSAYRPDDASAVAAETANEALLDALEHGARPEEAMRKALVSAARAVTDLADENPPDRPVHQNSPACTCVSAVTAGSYFTVGWVGDSRAYWIPDDRNRPPARLTEDDSWAARMVAAGLMSEAQAYADDRAHAITGWLGADAVELDPHTASFQPDEPGVVVVCTDGLWNYAESAEEMSSVVPPDARSRPLHCAQALVGVALDGGGHDNVTVAVLPFPAAVGRAESPSSPQGV